MAKFSENRNRMYMTKLGAKFDAYRARRQGFKTEIKGPYDNWYTLGGRYQLCLARKGNNP